MSLGMAVGWNQVIFKVPSNSGHSMILIHTFVRLCGKGLISIYTHEGAQSTAAGRGNQITQPWKWNSWPSFSHGCPQPQPKTHGPWQGQPAPGVRETLDHPADWGAFLSSSVEDLLCESWNRVNATEFEGPKWEYQLKEWRKEEMKRDDREHKQLNNFW